MDYIEITVTFSPDANELAEIVIARLAENGFESFSENTNVIQAYIPVTAYNKEQTDKIIREAGLEYTESLIKEQNWNAIWESNFEPVVIDKKCLIKAGFHKNLPSYPVEILIEPKMSFGTGHHETTSLMVSLMLDLKMKNKNVLDMGCGTGILAILASKLGAASVTGIDIDPLSYENAVENAAKNNVLNVSFLLGDASVIPKKHFDIILANINRNVLLEDIKVYAEHVVNKGVVILSGFYSGDVEIIKGEATKNHLKFHSFKEKNNWIAVHFSKNI